MNWISLDFFLECCLKAFAVCTGTKCIMRLSKKKLPQVCWVSVGEEEKFLYVVHLVQPISHGHSEFVVLVPQ